MKTSQKIIIGVLVVAVIVLGYFIYTAQKSSLYQNPAPVVPRTTQTEPPAVASPAFDINALLAQNPGSGATSAELTAFSAKVSSYAVDTSSVDVTGCAPLPIVSRVSLNKPISFKNTDSVSHKLVNGNLTIDVPASGSKSITPNFAGPGIYGYSCDSKMVGIFLVMP